MLSPILYSFAFLGVLRLTQATSDSPRPRHDPGCVSIGYDGDVYYRGQKMGLKYSRWNGCYMWDSGLESSEQDVSALLDAKESLMRQMPAGWDPLRPHMFRGRELCDRRGQPLRLINDHLKFTSHHLRVADSLYRDLELPQIKDLCLAKIGKLEVKNDESYYRGHPLDELQSLCITDGHDGIIHLDYNCKSSHHEVDEILYRADLEWLRKIVKEEDVQGFSSFLEEYPSGWKYKEGQRIVYKSLADAFFELSPNQKMTDLYLEKYRSEFLATYGKELPDTAIDSQLIELKHFINAVLPIGDFDRVIKRRSASIRQLSALQLEEEDSERFMVIASCMGNSVPLHSAYVDDVMSELGADRKDQFKNLLKNIWLELLPVYISQNSSLVQIVWDNTKDMDSQQTKNYINKIEKLVRTLRQVSRFLETNEMTYEIACRVRSKAQRTFHP